MNKTPIEWTTFSANPLKFRDEWGNVAWGCVKTSPGCAHCYSEAIAQRFNRGGPFTVQAINGLRPFLDDAECHKMRTAKTIGGVPVAGSRCFIGDMTDIFGEWVSNDLLNHLFSDVLEVRTDVTWQLLTKRAERMHDYLSWRWAGRIPSRHIHIGVSVENQHFADERIPLLLQTPAAVRFISAEPLLGGLDLRPWLQPTESLRTIMEPHPLFLDWVIVGGEKVAGGKVGRNPTDYEAHARAVLQQCAAAGVAGFHKQMPVRGRVSGDPAEWPADLRVRQFPDPILVSSSAAHEER